MAVVVLSILVVSPLIEARQGASGAGAGQGRQGDRAPAIVGRVVDARGLAVTDVFVTALTPQPNVSRGFSFVSARLGSMTNEQGEFRLDVGRLGEFYLVALPHNRLLNANGQPNRVGYANTFYPNATRVADARRVVVNAGSPATAHITLAPATLAVVAGTVTGSEGRLVPSGVLGVSHGDGLFGLDSRRMTIGANGSFVIPAFPPGTYYLQFREGAWPPARGEIPLVSGAKVVVDGRDIPDVRVKTIRMVAATGRVVVDDGSAFGLKPSEIRIGASPIDFDGNPGPQQPGVLRDDMTFEFKTWPSVGIVRVTLPSASPQAPLPEWTVKAVKLNGADVTDKPVEFAEGKVVSGLEIVLARRK
jgi:hypothetical protein